MFHLQRTAISAIAFLSSNVLFAQTTWYVDVNATPPGSGTLASPYASIQFAHDQVSTLDFDTLLVAPGTYFENIALSKRLTVRATGGAEVTTLRPAGAGPIVSLYGPSDEPESITLEGFTITGVFGSANTAAVLSFDGKLLRCIVRGNRGASYYGVITGYDTYLVDCTIADNDNGVESTTLGDAIWMKNCILWGNGVNFYGNPSPFYYDVHDNAGGPFPVFMPGNINGDPGMWNTAGGDYHLRPGSPCIDAGDPTLPNDPDGSRSDIGYYAYDPAYAFGPESYCTGKLNSHGCVPIIAASGTASLTNPNPFLITASLVMPGRRGLLLYSLTPDSAPFQGATLCVGPSFKRFAGQTSLGSGTCGGTYAVDFNIRIQSGADAGLVPGAIAYAQWWQRDPNDPAGFMSGLTDALSFGIAP